MVPDAQHCHFVRLARHFVRLAGLLTIALAVASPLGGDAKAFADDTQPSPAQPSTTVEMRDHDRLVWIGGTFVERMQQDNYLETLLSAAFPAKKLTFRNLGWSGDTVAGESRGVFGGPNEGFARLVKDTREAKPTVLLVQYGANEANRGPEGVPPFVTGLNRLLDALADTKARVVLVSPCPREKLPAPLPDPSRYNEHLQLYERALRDVATQRGCAFVSLADVHRAIPVPWTAPPANFRFTENSLHLQPRGAYLIAASIAAKFGARFEPWRAEIDAKELAADASGVSVSELKRTPTGVAFDVVDRVGPLPAAPASRRANEPALFAGEPLLRIKGLAAGQYVLKADGQAVVQLSADAWAQGSTALTALRVERAERLRATIRDKNELYFHRHRPQNETYLFLFRKHEQGNNAVEIPQFDPLVAEKEKVIFELSQPVRQHLELSRVE